MVLIMGYLLNHCDDGRGHPTVIPPLASLSADCCQAPLGGARMGASARCCHRGTEGTDDAASIIVMYWEFCTKFWRTSILK